MIEATFQLVRGLGATRERQLWGAGVRRWCDLPVALAEAERFLPGGLAGRLAAAVAESESALSGGDLVALARRFPAQERWRLFGRFAEEAVYLDIETDLDAGITAIGLLDARGPRILLGEAELSRFPEILGEARLLVTFNGSSFDVPVLRRFYPDWTAPAVHIDLRHVCARLGLRGGLKAIEERVGIGRPPHLRGLDGFDAARLWRLAGYGDKQALRLFAEYNLYDTINLRTLMALAYNDALARLGREELPLHVSYRGDVLYDVTRELMRVCA